MESFSLRLVVINLLLASQIYKLSSATPALAGGAREKRVINRMLVVQFVQYPAKITGEHWNCISGTYPGLLVESVP